jgi:hypothetical protein
MRHGARTIAAAMAVAFATHAGAQDETERAIRAALKDYRAGHTLDAKQALDKASQWIAAAAARKLDKYLPAPLDGWSVEEEDGGQDGQGGLNASRSYTNGTHRLTVSITADVAILGAVAVGFVYASGAQKAGARIAQVNGAPAIVTEDGQIQVLISGRFLLIAEGDADEQVKKSFLKTVDVKGLTNL